MKQYWVRLCSIFVSVLLLAGCGEKTGQGAIGSTVWKEMPALTHGVMESEKLDALEWNSGRCEAVSDSYMAEAENGYYWGLGSLLYYADKADPDNWVLVCNQPDCDHKDKTKCNAYIESGCFVIRNDRIYIMLAASPFPHLYSGKGETELLVSMKADGTDRQLAYVIEDAVLSDAGSLSYFLNGSHWLLLISAAQPDGGNITRLFRVTDAGTAEIPIPDQASDSGDSVQYIVSGSMNGLGGDSVFWCSALDKTPGIYHRFVGDALERVDLTGLETAGAYLSGDTLRHFRPGDGYYDVDLETGEETRVAPAQLENSRAQILLPNCVIESTLLDRTSTEGRQEGMEHTMRFFDGQKWYDVEMPEELKNAPGTWYLKGKAVTSDAIFLYCQDTRDPSVFLVYSIRLDGKAPELVPCGALPDPNWEQ